ncbi:family 20 glycosylhydrolase [Caballeronia insecticola]|uniref:beta-N-acetylhexosaminidase n=1 Tax=Caballeronia insecticola TaxID=758793 RepID=R4WGN9_9BURK|nr:family 20 glycosylhydrolase [Caballeronia insecticola]BAN23128.1 beta-N-acetylhexosaminidase [Caballeronia insecticola]
MTTAVAASLLLTSCGGSNSGSANLTPSARAAALGENLQMRVEIDTNDAATSGTNCADLGADWASCARGKLILENTGGRSLAAGGWTLYVHSIRRILAVEHPAFAWKHITGDLYALTPAAGAFTLGAGERIEVPFVGEYWYQRYSDLLPRAYVVADGSETPAILKHNDTDDETRYVDRIPPIKDDATTLAATPAQVQRARAEAALPTAQQTAARAVPAVLRETAGEGAVQIGGIDLSLAGLSASQVTALRSRATTLGLNGPAARVSGQIVGAALPGDTAKSGGYRLTIASGGVNIDAFDAAGLYYGAQTLLSLTPAGGGSVPAITIEDAPRYSYRGMHVDVARNFRQPATLRRLIDQMGAYKLNRLHLHLSDDEGWRIEIPGLPELTEIGSKRCHDLTEMRCLVPQLGSGPDNRSGGGYLSRAEYVALVRYAADRFVEIVPEIDMPGHARAAVVSMEARYQRLRAKGDAAGASAYRLLDPADTSNTTTVQFYDRRSFLNPCSDGAQRFASKVIGEIAAMHREAGAPISVWHFGGDEAKNILLGSGFQPLDGTDAGKGRVNLAAQDKPWARSPQCTALLAAGKAASVDELPSMFARQVSQIVRTNGIGTMAAWQDGIKHANGPQDFATANMMVTMWDPIFWGAADTVQSLGKQGYKTVLALPDYLYFDFPYSLDQHERGYYWGSHATDSFKTFSLAPDNLPQNAEIMADRDGVPFEVTSAGPAPHIEGIQGQAWAEVMRNDQQFEYMVYPRVLALAERAWHRAAWELPYRDGERFKLGDTNKVDKAALAQDWAGFMSVVQNRELPKLTRAGALMRPALGLSN